MKKYINIILVISLLFVLSSCFTSNNDIESVKNDLIGTDKNNEINKEETNKTEETEKTNEEKFEENISKFDEIEENIENNKSNVEINYLDDNRFIEFDDLESKDLSTKAIEITGKTLVNVDKIIVNFSNIESSFPEDRYQLQTFKSGAENFKYRAFEEYEVMDDGRNKYVFEIYSGESISKVEVILNVEKEEIKVETRELENENNSEENMSSVDVSELPSSGVYGNPRDIGSNKVAYSDIMGLEISTDFSSDITIDSDEVTSFLADNVNGWFFWNTLRPIKGQEDGVSFFVIRVDGEKYFYEKYYIIPEKNILGVLTLETGTGISSEELSEKNKEFKEKNEDFQMVSIADILFKEIID